MAWPWRDEPGKDGALSLFTRLKSAQQANDWKALADMARDHLQDDSAPLHEVSVQAMRLLRPWQAAVGPSDVDGLLDAAGDRTLKAYLSGPSLSDRLRMADRALALHCLGLLGQAEDDPVHNLRALVAAALAAGGVGRTRERRFNFDLVTEAIAADTLLPAWSFAIDPCRRQPGHGLGDVKTHVGHETPSKLGIRGFPVGDRTVLSPLEDRIRAIDAIAVKPGGADECDCARDEPVCMPQSVCCAPIRYYVTDLLELRDWTHGYKAGDLAYIEVVAAGESRSREHQMKRVTELYSEEETTTRNLQKRDHQVTETSSLTREIERQLENKASGEVSAEGKYDTKLYTATLSATFAYDRTATQAIREAQEQAREAVSNAVSEIEKQTRALRSERITTEETETNTHAFDNRTGATPLVTKYFWVTQVKRAQLFNYGRRLIMEMIVPSPARLYEHMLERRREAEVAKIPGPAGEAPDAPAAIDFNANEITPSNYLSKGKLHGASGLPAPPQETSQVTESTSYNKTIYGQKTLASVSITIPPGFHATSMSVSGQIDPRSIGSLKEVDFKIGSAEVRLLSNGAAGSVSLSDLTGTQVVTIIGHNINNFSAAITLNLVVDASVMDAWRQSVFEAIQAGHESLMVPYRAELQAWNAKLAEYEAAKAKLRDELKAKETDRHPFYNREIERTELKRALIYLMCQEFSEEGALIRKARPCGYPEIDRKHAEAFGYDWYFWDRLFDWAHMAYAFFDYFSNPMCDWPDRFDPANPDPLFKSFLRAGHARVLVPVSPDMETDFLWYASTRQKWGKAGSPPLDPDDPRWRNVVYELKHASASAMTPREGHVENVTSGDPDVLIVGTDRYWTTAGGGALDTAAIAADVDRELLIDGVVYLVAGIALAAGSPAHNPAQPNSMWWRVTLDRPYEGASSPRRLYAMGAQAVAPAFSFELPTELVWAGAHDACLPTYPLPACPE